MELSENRELGKLPATLILLLLRKNITNKPRTRRMQLELLEESKLMEVLFTIHQLMKSTTKLQNLSLKQNQLVKPHQKKPQMRAERSSKITSRRPLLLSKLKTLSKPREPLKSRR